MEMFKQKGVKGLLDGDVLIGVLVQTWGIGGGDFFFVFINQKIYDSMTKNVQYPFKREHNEAR